MLGVLKVLKRVAFTKCKTPLVETVKCTAHANDQMLGIHQVTKQMAP